MLLQHLSIPLKSYYWALASQILCCGLLADKTITKSRENIFKPFLKSQLRVSFKSLRVHQLDIFSVSNLLILGTPWRKKFQRNQFHYSIFQVIVAVWCSCCLFWFSKVTRNRIWYLQLILDLLPENFKKKAVTFILFLSNLY